MMMMSNRESHEQIADDAGNAANNWTAWTRRSSWPDGFRQIYHLCVT